MKNLITLGIVGAAIGVAYYIYKNNKDHKALIASAQQKISEAEDKINQAGAQIKDMGSQIKNLTAKVIKTEEIASV